MSLILGDNIGFRETLETELKEFIIKIDPALYYDENEIIDTINTGIIDHDKFNAIIFDNLNHYFKYYLPKYISVYANSKLDNAELYIGIDDFGEITGIPFFGNFNENILNGFLPSIIPFIKSDTNNEYDLLKKIKFEIIPLIKDMDYLDDSFQNIINEYFDKKHKYEKEYFENLRERLQWKEKVDYYLTKLVDYMNKPNYKKELIDFINSSEDSYKYKNVIDQLENNEYIDIENYNQIEIRKQNKNDIIHWVTTYKDMMIDKLKNNKPVKIPYVSFSTNIYNYQFTMLNNLRYRFCKNNKNINYYLIKITLPTKNIGNVYFKNFDSDNWIMRTRAIVNGAPGCY